jgi:hypothetical protein
MDVLCHINELQLLLTKLQFFLHFRLLQYFPNSLRDFLLHFHLFLLRVSTNFIWNLSKRHCVEILAPFIKVDNHIGSHQPSHVEFLVLFAASVVNGDYLLVHADGSSALPRHCAEAVSDHEPFWLNKDNFVFPGQTVLIQDKLFTVFIVGTIVVVAISGEAKDLKVYLFVVVHEAPSAGSG